MGREICREMIGNALGREITEREARALLDEVEQRANLLRATDASLAFNDALRAAGAEFKRSAELAGLAKQRNTVLNATRRLEALEYVRANWADDPAAGLKALLVGVQGARAGARKSAGNEWQALHNQYLGGLIADVERVPGGTALFGSGALDAEVARALWQLNRATPALDGLDPRAVDLARAVHKWQEVARLNANDAGAWIGKLDGYIVTQSHDGTRIAADRAGWEAMARQTMDLPRMMAEQGATNVDDLLAGLWQNLADGVHLKVGGAPAGGKGLRGMAGKLSQERVIHFADADAWTTYNQAFGGGNLREAVTHGLERNARATGLMRTLGPNHEMVYGDLVTDILRDMKARGVDPQKTRDFQTTAKRFGEWYLAELDGRLDVPGSNTLASASAGIRAVQNMASLGGSMLSSVADLGVMMLGAKFNGLNAFELVGQGVGQLFQGVPRAERLELLADLGMAFESMSGKLASNRFSLDDGARGVLGVMQQQFFKLNLQNRWTDSMRQASAEFLSANLARRAGDGWDALPEALRSTLGLYGLTAKKWDVIRQGALQEDEGLRFLTPSALDDVPDDAIAASLGEGATARQIADARKQMQRELRAYYVDQNSYLLLSPDAGTRGALKVGTQRGTAAGEAIRFVMQFKSFAFAFSQKVAGREFKQSGAMLGVARMIAATTVFGYLAMTLKDLSKGRQPRDLNDYRSWLAAVQQGGGLGIYGDVLFSQVVNRRYTDAGLQLLGPTASDLFGSNGVTDIAARAVTGDDAGAASVRFLQSNTPFLNLFYARSALDYAVFWQLQEAMNPGSLERMEKRVQEQSGQQFLVSPSDTVQ